MILESISILNFRNFNKLELSFDPSGNLFLGENGSGKTNLLEAIHYLGIARSQRGASDFEMVKMGSDCFLLKGVRKSEEGEREELEVIQDLKEGRTIFLNHEKQRRVADLIGHLPLISLSLKDDEIIAGPPQERRRFLDISISQTSQLYLSHLQQYRESLQQRNRILQRLREGDRVQVETLEAWDAQLIESGSKLIQKRKDVIEKISSWVASFSQLIGGDSRGVGIEYRPSFPLQGTDVRDSFASALKKSRPQERTWGVTLTGPHRDDISFHWHELNLRRYGSQGENHIAAIALKLAFSRYIQEERKTKPLLLLDEVFSELDGKRSRLLLQLLPQQGQIFLATAKETDFLHIDRVEVSFKRFSVRDGNITVN